VGKQFSSYEVAKVHQYQGRESERVLIIATTNSQGDYGICKEIPYVITALTRATKQLVWVVVNDPSPKNDIKTFVSGGGYNKNRIHIENFACLTRDFQQIEECGNHGYCVKTSEICLEEINSECQCGDHSTLNLFVKFEVLIMLLTGKTKMEDMWCPQHQTINWKTSFENFKQLGEGLVS